MWSVVTAVMVSSSEGDPHHQDSVTLHLLYPSHTIRASPALNWGYGGRRALRETRGGPGRPMDARESPGRPREARGSPGTSGEAREGPGKPDEARGGTGGPWEVRGGPGRPREAWGVPETPEALGGLKRPGEAQESQGMLGDARGCPGHSGRLGSRGRSTYGDPYRIHRVIHISMSDIYIRNPYMIHIRIHMGPLLVSGGLLGASWGSLGPPGSAASWGFLGLFGS